jgi:PII-like signaling protein
MSEPCVKLSTYFGERDRVAGRLLADELLDIYSERKVRASVLLRGTEGFGRLHHLRTDRLLSLSEDLPVVSIALESSARLGSLVERVLQVKRRGLITLERARLTSPDDDFDSARIDNGETDKLTVFVGRGERIAGAPAFVVICELFQRHGFDGASVLVGVDGLLDGVRSRARFFSRNAEVPLTIEAVGARERASTALPELYRVLGKALILRERARVCKRDGKLLHDPRPLDHTDGQGDGLAQKLTVYSSHDATHEGRPLHLEIVRRLRSSDAAGVTTLTGVWGFHGDHPPHGDRLLQLHRHVPVATVTVDSPERIARSFAIVDELTDEHGLVIHEVVPFMQAIVDGAPTGSLRLGRPPA